MISNKYFLIGLHLLVVCHVAKSFVILSANIDDVKKLAKEFSGPLTDEIVKIILKATKNVTLESSHENEANGSTSNLNKPKKKKQKHNKKNILRNNFQPIEPANYFPDGIKDRNTPKYSYIVSPKVHNFAEVNTEVKTTCTTPDTNNAALQSYYVSPQAVQKNSIILNDDGYDDPEKGPYDGINNTDNKATTKKRDTSTKLIEYYSNSQEQLHFHQSKPSKKKKKKKSTTMETMVITNKEITKSAKKEKNKDKKKKSKVKKHKTTQTTTLTDETTIHEKPVDIELQKFEREVRGYMKNQIRPRITSKTTYQNVQFIDTQFDSVKKAHTKSKRFKTQTQSTTVSLQKLSKKVEQFNQVAEHLLGTTKKLVSKRPTPAYPKQDYMDYKIPSSEFKLSYNPNENLNSDDYGKMYAKFLRNQMNDVDQRSTLDKLTDVIKKILENRLGSRLMNNNNDFIRRHDVPSSNIRTLTRGEEERIYEIIKMMIENRKIVEAKSRVFTKENPYDLEKRSTVHAFNIHKMSPEEKMADVIHKMVDSSLKIQYEKPQMSIGALSETLKNKHYENHGVNNDYKVSDMIQNLIEKKIAEFAKFQTTKKVPHLQRFHTETRANNNEDRPWPNLRSTYENARTGIYTSLPTRFQTQTRPPEERLREIESKYQQIKTSSFKIAEESTFREETTNKWHEFQHTQPIVQGSTIKIGRQGPISIVIEDKESDEIKRPVPQLLLLQNSVSTHKPDRLSYSLDNNYIDTTKTKSSHWQKETKAYMIEKFTKEEKTTESTETTTIKHSDIRSGIQGNGGGSNTNGIPNVQVVFLNVPHLEEENEKIKLEEKKKNEEIREKEKVKKLEEINKEEEMRLQAERQENEKKALRQKIEDEIKEKFMKEEQKRMEEIKKLEAMRKEELKRIEEEKRMLEEKKIQEQKRLQAEIQEIEKKALSQKIENEIREKFRKEEQKRMEEIKNLEAIRKEQLKRIEEEKRMLEEKKIQEQKKLQAERQEYEKKALRLKIEDELREKIWKEEEEKRKQEINRIQEEMRMQEVKRQQKERQENEKKALRQKIEDEMKEREYLDRKWEKDLEKKIKAKEMADAIAALKEEEKKKNEAEKKVIDQKILVLQDKLKKDLEENLELKLKKNTQSADKKSQTLNYWEQQWQEDQDLKLREDYNKYMKLHNATSGQSDKTVNYWSEQWRIDLENKLREKQKEDYERIKTTPTYENNIGRSSTMPKPNRFDARRDHDYPDMYIMPDETKTLKLIIRKARDKDERTQNNNDMIKSDTIMRETNIDWRKPVRSKLNKDRIIGESTEKTAEVGRASDINLSENKIELQNDETVLEESNKHILRAKSNKKEKLKHKKVKKQKFEMALKGEGKIEDTIVKKKKKKKSDKKEDMNNDYEKMNENDKEYKRKKHKKSKHKKKISKEEKDNNINITEENKENEKHLKKKKEEKPKTKAHKKTKNKAKKEKDENEDKDTKKNKKQKEHEGTKEHQKQTEEDEDRKEHKKHKTKKDKRNKKNDEIDEWEREHEEQEEEIQKAEENKKAKENLKIAEEMKEKRKKKNKKGKQPHKEKYEDDDHSTEKEKLHDKGDKKLKHKKDKASKKKKEKSERNTHKKKHKKEEVKENKKKENDDDDDGARAFDFNLTIGNNQTIKIPKRKKDKNKSG